VTIGDVTFDWEPSTPAGVAVLMSGRGTDRRLDRDDRISAAERKAARIDRRRPRTDAELLEAEQQAPPIWDDTVWDESVNSGERPRTGP
jgi:GTP-binding protein